MKLTKEDYIKHVLILHHCLCYHEEDESFFDALEQLEQLIKEHFEFQLTSQEIDLIRYALRPLEDELGMDVTLLMDKLWRMVDILPKEKELVECVEYD